ncbi:MAG: AMP-binding protein [Alicyclobacillaceae bacterium]|nr:AMP-binding protein [Alicyclobacillaceae bacterium]
MDKRLWHRHWPKGLPLSIAYPEVPVWAVIKGSAARFGNKTALVYGPHRHTYRELYENSLRFAVALRKKGIGKGDVVAVHMHNTPQYAVAYYGILMSGAIFSPVNPLLPPDDLAYQLNDCGAAAVVTHERFASALQSVESLTPLRFVMVTGEEEAGPPYRPVNAEALGNKWYSFGRLVLDETPGPPAAAVDPLEDLAHLAYTGGTTGRSKGVMLTHYNVVVNTLQFACWGTGCLPAVEDGGLVLRPADPSLIGPSAEYRVPVGKGVLINITPWFHAMGTVGYLNHPVLTGAEMILHSRFDPGLYLEEAERRRVTTIGGAPPVFVALLRHPDLPRRDLRSVRQISSGAAPLPGEIFRALTEFFPEATVVEGYGMTELAMGAISNPAGRSGLRKAGSVGIPVFDTECKIVSLDGCGDPLPPKAVGEICIRGPQVMRGYFNQPEETASVLKDGWMYTGDIGMMDEDGYVYIVDRKKDMLIYKGYNVYPRELEEILFRHPSVANAAVIGKPVQEVGEIPKAFVVLKAGERATAEDLMNFVNERVAPYKKLREVAFVDEIPVSAAGKVLKRVLREREIRNSAPGRS